MNKRAWNKAASVEISKRVWKQASERGNKRAKGTALSQNVDIREQNVRSKNLYLTEVVKQAVVAGAYHDVAVLRPERLQQPPSIHLHERLYSYKVFSACTCALQ